MSFDESFLSPRDLLTNSKTFCCDGPSFFKLQQATQATQNLPYNDSGLDYRVPFTEQGRQELYVDLLIPVMEHFYTITSQSMNLEGGYRSVGDICDYILKLSATAKEDYDEIFNDLGRLYDDESDNESLRAEVQAKIKDRLDKVNGLSKQCTSTTDNLVAAIGNVTEGQKLVKQVGEELGRQDTIDRLRKCHEGDINGQEGFESDCRALDILNGIIANQNMQNDSSASLANLQLAVGAAYNIFNDLTALTEYITENTEPGPGPLLNLKENELLEMWSDLAVEVQKFKESYQWLRYGVYGSD
ncbi:hypothetical protein DTO013E5_584 [Penicillium roqueforti]|uniref:uncharacterized protein n=1 Tax=Penicillium roqueforti TaxID=5082 RepID=UPI00190E1E4B|nr:uncharacterized protein LCP9604111_555 [Penicillium roqueforti]KAF9253029.1 hypothetical protein LCP9604111_555 [Penicillium roqueforti]KAI1838545.1 hypothetical protein CBS147337_270 [Penicillium roqueforti]KAI2680545.1 hypothetical protein CBS147355_3525 [Penicillium roqueforti]KAI2691066.1 hypothetical protein LCP963914a_1267 [Penicillium roqueforti]KAI2706961.1 hypothetical protein CBS147372_872 [Penicillium roqueforti]